MSSIFCLTILCYLVKKKTMLKTNIAEAMIIAAIDKPFPLPYVLFALFNPIPPKIHPNNGIKNEHTKPAMANTFVPPSKL